MSKKITRNKLTSAHIIRASSAITANWEQFKAMTRDQGAELISEQISFPVTATTLMRLLKSMNREWPGIRKPPREYQRRRNETAKAIASLVEQVSQLSERLTRLESELGGAPASTPPNRIGSMNGLHRSHQ